MPNIEEVKSQLSGWEAAKGWAAKPEVDELPKVLWDDESIRGALQGSYGGGSGLLVATDRRLVFVNKKFIGVKVEDFAYDKVTSIQYELNILSADVKIFASGNAAEIESALPKHQVREFCEVVRGMISAAAASIHATDASVGVVAETAPPGSAGKGGTAGVVEMADALERLAQLRVQGLLSEEEFEEQKRRLLDGP